MNHGSLFSGIGGFDLAAEWMGWNNVFHCEWNEFGKKVLKYYWPKAISYGDITKTDFTIHRGGIDILTGGFPCQPYSQAGKRKGKEDERHLWPEMLRAIREIQPAWVVGENVRGLTNWNGGMVFDEVQADLEAEGYEVLPFLLPACAVNAPHRRDRIWFIAHSKHDRHQAGRKEEGEKNRISEKRRSPMDTGQFNGADISWITTNANSDGHELRGSEQDRCEERKSESVKNQRERIWSNTWRNGESGTFAVTRIQGLQGNELNRENNGKNKERRTGTHGTVAKFYRPDNWQNFPTQSPICNGNDGISSRLDRITFPKWRTESIKGGAMP